MSIKEEIFVPVHPEVPRVLAGQQLLIYIPEHLDAPLLADKIVETNNRLDEVSSNLNQELRNDLVSKKPDGGNLLIDANNKITMTYLPDAILGQLVFGGTVSRAIISGSSSGLLFNFTSNAMAKLKLQNDTLRTFLADIDAKAWEGLYFIIKKELDYDPDSWIITDANSNSVTMRVDDWFLSTGTEQNPWQTIDTTDAVQSVANKTGNVVLETADINGLPEKFVAIESSITAVQDESRYELSQRLKTIPDGKNPFFDDNTRININYLPDAILGQLVFGGVAYMYERHRVNGVVLPVSFSVVLSTNAKTKLNIAESQIIIDENTRSSWYEGLYFVVAQGNSQSLFFNSVHYSVGDWLLGTPDSWAKIDNTDAVQSVAGQTGAVTLYVNHINGLPEKLAEIENRLTITILEEGDEV